MRYKEIITEVGNATLLVDNLRKNLEIAATSGVASKFEGIDAVVRLGYLGKHSPESIAKSFGISEPWDEMTPQILGSYTAATDELKTVYRRLMDPNARLDTATTVSHELRHRGFRVISELPELNNLMPSDLRTKWKDGYGKFNKGSYRGANDRSPEHAMIYSVQEPDLDNSPSRSKFLKHPSLGGRKAQYWSDLYNEVNNVVKDYLEQKMKQPTTGELPDGELATLKDGNRNFRLEPWIKEYYTAWDTLKYRGGMLANIMKLGSALDDYAIGTIGADGDWKKLYDEVEVVRNNLGKGHFVDVKKGLETLTSSSRYKWKYRAPFELAGKMTRGSSTTQVEWNKIADNLQTLFDLVVQTVGSDWSNLDVRYYDGTFVRSFAPLVKKPKPPVVPVEPVQPSANPQNPTNPPLPSPKSGSMSFKQFAQQTKSSSGKTYWQEIIATRNSASLKSYLMLVDTQAFLAGLKIDPTTKVHMDTLITAWDGIAKANRTESVLSAVADVFLSQVMLVSRR